jgi:hypothetical protein
MDRPRSGNRFGAQFSRDHGLLIYLVSQDYRMNTLKGIIWFGHVTFLSLSLVNSFKYWLFVLLSLKWIKLIQKSQGMRFCVRSLLQWASLFKVNSASSSYSILKSESSGFLWGVDHVMCSFEVMRTLCVKQDSLRFLDSVRCEPVKGSIVFNVKCGLGASFFWLLQSKLSFHNLMILLLSFVWCCFSIRHYFEIFWI